MNLKSKLRIFAEPLVRGVIPLSLTDTLDPLQELTVQCCSNRAAKLMKDLRGDGVIF